MIATTFSGRRCVPITAVTIDPNLYPSALIPGPIAIVLPVSRSSDPLRGFSL